MKRTKVIIAFLGAIAAMPAFSQSEQIPDTAQIPEVLIRARIAEDTLQKIPAHIGVLSVEEINSNNGTSLTAALNKVPGVYMQQAAISNNRIVLRGMGARSQYGSNRVKAYLNNIPITTGSGETVIDDIDVDILESVKVISGPNSLKNGAGLGGSIELNTLKPRRNQIKLNVAGGSFGMFKTSVGAALTGNGTYLQAHYNRLESKGYRENNAYLRNSAFVNGGVRVSTKMSMDGFVHFSQLNAQIPSSLNITDFKENPTAADKNWREAKGYESFDKWISGISVNYISNNFKNTTSIFGHYRDGYEPRPFDILDEEQLGFGARTHFQFNFPIFKKSSTLSFGAEYYLENYTVSLFENRYKEFPGRGSVQGEKINGNDQFRSYVNVFVEQEIEIAENLFSTLGMAANYTRYDLQNNFTPGAPKEGYDYGIILSPLLALNYQIAVDKHIFASLGRGFSTPGIEETLTPSGDVNTDLLPETGVNAEVGMKFFWFQKKLFTGITFFNTQVHNLLVAERIAEDQYVGINAGKARHSGIEVDVHYRNLINDNWLLRPYFTLAINDFKFRDFKDNDLDFSGNEITGVPRQTASLGVESEFVNGIAFLVHLYHAARIPLNDANTIYSDAYTLLNFKMSYKFRAVEKLPIEAYVGINNILNTAYAASVLPNAVGFGGAQPRYYYPGDARNFYVGISMMLRDRE